ncbi:hypothetical protein R2F61_04075 [Mollicutes bacterium LVI A0078]|nr:hypothetical protein RZE84_04095 [Mollicutes bacterium LVI A0075]WOO91739.1 hypothetical protein R2F61_04075 [Mollicutes bacterium LVI A0078]
MSISSVKYKVFDLQSAQSEFDIILDILEDNEALLDSLVVDLDEFSSLAVTKLQEQIEEFRDMHYQMTEDMESAKTEIIETEKNATEKFKPLDYNKVLELKTPEVLSALKSIGNVLDDNLSSSSLAPTPDFISWINKTDNELNDGIIEALNNPIDERRQRKAEEVYHANQAVYESAYESFLDDMTFQTEIEYIEQVIREMDGFSKEDFPLIAEGTLYETMFEGAVGVTYNDFTETVSDEYEVTYLEREGNKIAWEITIVLLVTPIPGDGAAALSALGAEYLPKLGKAGKFLANVGVKLKAAWTMERLEGKVVASAIKDTFITLETHDLVMDLLNKQPMEFITDILIMPLNTLNILDNEFFNFNGSDESTLESSVGKILEFADGYGISLDKLENLHTESRWV